MTRVAAGVAVCHLPPPLAATLLPPCALLPLRAALALPRQQHRLLAQMLELALDGAQEGI